MCFSQERENIGVTTCWPAYAKAWARQDVVHRGCDGYSKKSGVIKSGCDAKQVEVSKGKLCFNCP